MMDTGLLWYDWTTNGLATKVRGAIAAYERKMGQRPDICYVRWPGELTEVDGVQVRASDTVMPNYFWVGVDVPYQPTEDWKTRRRDAYLRELDDDTLMEVRP